MIRNRKSFVLCTDLTCKAINSLGESHKNDQKYVYIYFFLLVVGALSLFYLSYDITKKNSNVLKLSFNDIRASSAYIANTIESAKKSIYISENTLSRFSVLPALETLYKKGIKIRLLKTNKSLPSTLPYFLQNPSKNVGYIDVDPYIANNIFLIIDKATIIRTDFAFRLGDDHLNGLQYILTAYDENIARMFIKHNLD